MADRLLVDADALGALLSAAADRPDPALRAALVALVRSGTTPAPAPRPWLSVAETADLLGVSERTVRRQAHRGQLEHRREGRRLLIATRCLAPTGPDRTRADSGGDIGPTGVHRDVHEQEQHP